MVKKGSKNSPENRERAKRDLTYIMKVISAVSILA
jgi:hypothetical protein